MLILVKLIVHLNQKYRSAHTEKSNLLIFSTQKGHWTRDHSLQLKCTRSIKIVLQMTSCQVNDNVKSVNKNSHDSCCRDPVFFCKYSYYSKNLLLVELFSPEYSYCIISYSFNWRLVYNLHQDVYSLDRFILNKIKCNPKVTYVWDCY